MSKLQQSLRMLSAIAFVIALSVTLTTAVRAEIYEWDDAEGRHFADSLEAIPKEARAGARLIVNSATSPPAPAPAAADTEQAPAPEAEANTRVATAWDSGFEAGWNAGYDAAVQREPVCPTEPDVIVLQSAPPVVNVPAYDPTGAYYRSPYAGSVTVPFDGGRSFGLTRREQMQRFQGR